MTAVNERNFSDVVTEGMRREFWARVKRTLRELYNVEPERADTYRRQVEDGASGLGQILVYHDEPLQIAADLAGVSLTADAMGRYGDWYPHPINAADQSVATLP
jgi:hypothetical protein